MVYNGDGSEILNAGVCEKSYFFFKTIHSWGSAVSIRGVVHTIRGVVQGREGS